MGVGAESGGESSLLVGGFRTDLWEEGDVWSWRMREGIVAPTRLQIWEKPGLGTVKLNFDGALDLKQGL